MLFERHIALDWSGAGLDSSRTPGLAVADHRGIVAPPKYTTWSRDEIDAYLRSVLDPDAPRAIVAIDAALSYPYGFQSAVFGVQSWREMVAAFAELRADHPTARELARALNSQFEDGGPFRFNDSRNDNSFYRNHGVAYYRAVDMIMPQCLSPFYLGSGATVGFHTITCLRTISRLLALRDAGEVSFHVWPQEGIAPRSDVHVIAECYPALYPAGGEDVNPHERDALRAVNWLLEQDSNGRLAPQLEPPELDFGRRAHTNWEDQIRFEGWVLGV